MTYDFIVAGAGMAGASVAYFLAENARVLVLEKEERPGFHSTGRSAALYTQAYGNAAVRALTVASKPFLDHLPEGFADHPVLTPRGAMFIGRRDQTANIANAVAEGRRFVPSIREIDTDEACSLVPVLRRDYVASACFEPEAMDMDVDILHRGFLRGARRRGGEIVTSAEVVGLSMNGDGWKVETTAGSYQGRVLINAAGAWGDKLAAMAGCRPVGLQPKRRSAFLVEPPPGVDISAWPMTIDVDEQFYFKPDAGRLLGSPADETPVEPQDIHPEDFDIAVAVDRIQRAADIEVRHIEHQWAGLRSFVADKTPVVGFDPDIESFFWLVGQGGYGIQTAAAMGITSAALAMKEAVPHDVRACGVSESALSPVRFRNH